MDKTEKKPNAFQRGFQGVQKGGKYGPDVLTKKFKGAFTGDKSPEELSKNKNSKPMGKTERWAFQSDKTGDVWQYDPTNKNWVELGSNRTISKELGAKYWNKSNKKSPQGVKFFKEEENMTDKKVQEGLGELADMAERDHEVQMARADLYKIAKYAIKLHDMLKQITEAEGLEGWQQSKITKAADYIGSVYHALDYDMKFGEAEVTEARDTHCSDKCCGSDVKAEDCTCPPTCKHCNCNAVKEGKSPHKKGTKKYKAHMAAMHAESKEDAYKETLRARLEEKKSVSKKKTDERSLTKSEKGKQEKYVKGMKKAKGDFKKRYGKDAEAVMYATATKMAKK